MKGIPGRPEIRSVSSEAWEDTSPEWRSRQIESVTYRMALGVDLSYSEGTGDFAAIVALAETGGRYYVRHVQRFRRDILNARKELLRAQRDWPGAPMCSYISGPEKGVLALLGQETVDEKGRSWPPVMIAGMRAIGDITLRAQAYAEAWNQGKIIVPPNRPWVQDYVDELRAFIGSGSRKDQVSASISAFDFLEASKSFGSTEVGSFKRTRV